ncbi:hypothetical protein OAU50_05645 [Planctomycetota bacterium]|nr:hypothetical protein [Planctomycetota bacterium]
MSRLEKSDLPNSSEVADESRQVLAKLNPLAKSTLYAGEYPVFLTQRERQALTREVRKRLRNEHPEEGMDGIPTRILQNVFADICEDDNFDCITPFAVFKLLDRVVDQGAINYDFLGRQRDDGFHDFRAFTAVLRQRYDEIISSEIENSIVDVSPAEIEVRIRDYLKHVTAYNQKEKLKDELTSKGIDPDESMMRGIEELMKVDDAERDFFRFRMVSRLTNALTGGTEKVKPGQDAQAIDLQEIFEDLFKALHRNLYQESKDKATWPDVKRYLERSDSREDLDARCESGDIPQGGPIQTLLDNMEHTYGYCYDCARPIILYYIDKRTEK